MSIFNIFLIAPTTISVITLTILTVTIALVIGACNSWLRYVLSQKHKHGISFTIKPTNVVYT